MPSLLIHDNCFSQNDIQMCQQPFATSTLLIKTMNIEKICRLKRVLNITLSNMALLYFKKIPQKTDLMSNQPILSKSIMVRVWRSKLN